MHQKSDCHRACRTALCGSLQANLTHRLYRGSIRYTLHIAIHDRMPVLLAQE
jgi:hypothetical protein